MLQSFYPKHKIEVEIWDEYGASPPKKYPVRGNKIIIRPETRNEPEYAVEFDKSCLIPYVTGWGPFKKLRYKTILLYGADRCLSISFNNGKAEIDAPLWDRDASIKLFKASVVKAAGATMQKINVPTALYILLGGMFILQFIILLITSGRVRFG